MLPWMCVPHWCWQEQKEVAFENCCGQVPLSVLGQFGVFEALHQGTPWSKVLLETFLTTVHSNWHLGWQMMGTNNIPSKNHLWRWKLRYPTLGKGKSMIFLFHKGGISSHWCSFCQGWDILVCFTPQRLHPRTPYDIHEEWLSTVRRWRCRTGGVGPGEVTWGNNLLGTNIYTQNGIFEDDFPFPKVGYVNSLEGISNIISHVSTVWSMFVWDLRGWIVDSVQLPAMKPHLFIETFWKHNWHSGRFEGIKSQSAKDMLKGR